MSVTVREAGLDDLETLAELFDRYRQFYRQPADLAGARDFLAARLAGGESRLLLAERDEVALGFCQLYASFTSIGMAPLWILNDLFVDAAVRRSGAGRALLLAARALAERQGVKRLVLATERVNLPAQTLYESLGWQRDEVYLHYGLRI
ncbi:GNAT family N-acetyltransferase [Crenobacter sp. SG2303]|uniref:GNAT family N-acetyltransferase n=1 Tax=Crenobacter oryzisoli TaxID=3056844 RepID=A0ABT7XTT4_9NEIS|nr:GNAT family N-acetyltransferase [Crenobacter sp. SG2303]MDN0077207.1 GNAT family N-acetyltransferase [Crenobacter sp. SG2303]